MKKIFIMMWLLAGVTVCNAQYTKDRLMNIIADGSSKSWTVKTSNERRAERAYVFNRNMNVNIENINNKITTDKWSLNTEDNIRWFMVIGKQKWEVIVSYDKAGKQFLKLTRQAGDGKTSVYYETLLYPAEK